MVGIISSAATSIIIASVILGIFVVADIVCVVMVVLKTKKMKEMHALYRMKLKKLRTDYENQSMLLSQAKYYEQPAPQRLAQAQKSQTTTPNATVVEGEIVE